VHDELVGLALTVAEAARLPYVQTVSGFGSMERGLRLSRSWCRRLVAASPDLVADLVVELGIPASIIALVPQGIPAQQDSPREDRSAKVPVVGTGGALEGVAGLMIFLDAAHLVVSAGYDVEFVIASHASEHVLLRDRARRLEVSDRVTVADYPIFDREFWSVLDIYCQPAVAASTGRTLMKALAHGVPSIATNVKGLRALIDSGENGLLVPPADPIALEQAITTLLDEPALARRLGQKAIERARTQFDLDAEADGLADLYRDVAG
jgi:glycosyltransferase involved in cell wall biosynthesis